MKQPKIPFTQEFMGFLQEHKRLTISGLVGSTGANQNTLKVRLRELVESGRIERHGKARATCTS